MVSVNQISVDNKGEYIASCSDGMVSIDPHNKYGLDHRCCRLIVLLYFSHITMEVSSSCSTRTFIYRSMEIQCYVTF